MSKSDTATKIAKGAGLAALFGLMVAGSVAEAYNNENEARRLLEQVSDEYTFRGYRYTHAGTIYVLKVTGDDGSFIELATTDGIEYEVVDTNLPGVKAGKQVHLADKRLQGGVESQTKSQHLYYCDRRRLSFFSMPIGQRHEAFLFQVCKKGEFVPMFLPSVKDMELSVL